jgi:hypothetical protein
VESLADQLSNFKTWLQKTGTAEIDEIRNVISRNVSNWKPYFQMLLPETAGPLLSLIGGAKSFEKLDQTCQTALLEISELWESTHEKVHVLDNFARNLLDETITSTTDAVTKGKQTIVGWLDEFTDTVSIVYQDIRE